MPKKRRSRAKQYHRTPAEICADFGKDGIGKFHRIGKAEGWQDFNIIFDHTLVFSMNIGPARLNEFHEVADKWWDEFESGNIGFDEMLDKAEDVSGVRITWQPVSDDYIDKVTKSKYLRLVGRVNRDFNNEILRIHAIHEACALLSLNEMGWQKSTIKKFDRCFMRRMEEVFVSHGPHGKNACVLKYRAELEGKYHFEYEKIVDYLEVENG